MSNKLILEKLLQKLHSLIPYIQSDNNMVLDLQDYADESVYT